MEGMSERQYAAHVGLSRGAIQKAKDAGRLVQYADGSIDAVASDARRAAMTDPAKQRGDAQQQLFQAQRDLQQARYSTILSQLRLKSASGRLKESDLAEVNSLLAK